MESQQNKDKDLSIQVQFRFNPIKAKQLLREDISPNYTILNGSKSDSESDSDNDWNDVELITLEQYENQVKKKESTIVQTNVDLNNPTAVLNTVHPVLIRSNSQAEAVVQLAEERKTELENVRASILNEVKPQINDKIIAELIQTEENQKQNKLENELSRSDNLFINAADKHFNSLNCVIDVHPSEWETDQHQSGTFYCASCAAVFKQMNQLSAHYENVHCASNQPQVVEADIENQIQVRESDLDAELAAYFELQPAQTAESEQNKEQIQESSAPSSNPPIVFQSKFFPFTPSVSVSEAVQSAVETDPTIINLRQKLESRVEKLQKKLDRPMTTCSICLDIIPLKFSERHLKKCQIKQEKKAKLAKKLEKKTNKKLAKSAQEKQAKIANNNDNNNISVLEAHEQVGLLNLNEPNLNQIVRQVDLIGEELEFKKKQERIDEELAQKLMQEYLEDEKKLRLEQEKIDREFAEKLAGNLQSQFYSEGSNYNYNYNHSRPISTVSQTSLVGPSLFDQALAQTQESKFMKLQNKAAKKLAKQMAKEAVVNNLAPIAEQSVASPDPNSYSSIMDRISSSNFASSSRNSLQPLIQSYNRPTQ